MTDKTRRMAERLIEDAYNEWRERREAAGQDSTRETWQAELSKKYEDTEW